MTYKERFDITLKLFELMESKQFVYFACCNLCIVDVFYISSLTH